eukprot:GHVQ01011428.1.p1 GENE.GHVQ01011428.1~~GHVQ01011428.1.p1  ORF type:complete len:218 (-),score=24.22 GHVQ01011428.1:147-800(-)
MIIQLFKISNYRMSLLRRLCHPTTSQGLLSPPASARSLMVSNRSITYDVGIIGGGPGGYVAAIKAAQLGLKTVCVEKRGTLGGTCLNVGCIPSKSLLNISHKYHEVEHMFPKMGIKVDNASVDVTAMMKQKLKSVTGLTEGIEFLFKKNKVDYVKGSGRLTSGTTIMVDGSNQLECKNIIIATGSESSPMPGGAIQVQRCCHGVMSVLPYPRWTRKS